MKKSKEHKHKSASHVGSSHAKHHEHSMGHGGCAGKAKKKK
jgi:hypothetical protein